MSGRLADEVLDQLPPGTTHADRVVAVAIALAANDHTRRAWPGMDRLAAKTRMQPNAIRRCLAHLAELGYDLRSSTAHRGQRTVYAIPEPAAKAHQNVAPFRPRKAPQPVAVNDDGMAPQSVAPLDRERRHNPIRKAPQSDV